MSNDIASEYDAYDKDIAIASFFFEEPVAYEYTRLGENLYHFESKT